MNLCMPRRRLLLALGALSPLARAQPPGLIEAARAEGRIASVRMPDDWANWRATWADLRRLYGLAHVDTDMSSAEQRAKRWRGAAVTADQRRGCGRRMDRYRGRVHRACAWAVPQNHSSRSTASRAERRSRRRWAAN